LLQFEGFITEDSNLVVDSALSPESLKTELQELYATLSDALMTCVTRQLSYAAGVRYDFDPMSDRPGIHLTLRQCDRVYIIFM